MPEARECAFCEGAYGPVDIDDPDATYREVTSWVTGPKLQGPVHREQTGRVAHAYCINKILNGQPIDQQSIPGLEPQ